MAAHRALKGRDYVISYVALVVLATASLLLSFLKLHEAQLFVAIGIAFVKAIVVAYFFMHLVEEPLSARMAVLVALLFFALLITLTALDVATRHTYPPAVSPTPEQGFYRR